MLTLTALNSNSDTLILSISISLLVHQHMRSNIKYKVSLQLNIIRKCFRNTLLPSILQEIASQKSRKNSWTCLNYPKCRISNQAFPSARNEQDSNNILSFCWNLLIDQVRAHKGIIKSRNLCLMKMITGKLRVLNWKWGTLWNGPKPDIVSTETNKWECSVKILDWKSGETNPLSYDLINKPCNLFTAHKNQRKRTLNHRWWDRTHHHIYHFYWFCYLSLWASWWHFIWVKYLVFSQDFSWEF